MRFVDENYEIFLEIVHQRKRRLAGFPAVKISRIVFYAVTIAHFTDHFDVVIDPFADTLRLYQFIVVYKLLLSFRRVGKYRFQRAFQVFRSYHIVRSGINRYMRQFVHRFHRDGIEFGNAFYRIAEKFDSDGNGRLRSRENFQSIALRPERTARKIYFRPGVLNGNQLIYNFVTIYLLTFTQRYNVLEIFFRGTQTVYTGYRSYDYDVVAFTQRRSRRMAQFIYFVVNGDLFFDISIGPGDIGFGLVIIVIRYKIFDAVFGEKLPEFVAKLRRQSFIMSDHQSGFADASYDVSHGKSLTGAGNAQQHLCTPTFVQSRHKFFYRFALIAAGGIGRG